MPVVAFLHGKKATNAIWLISLRFRATSFSELSLSFKPLFRRKKKPPSTSALRKISLPMAFTSARRRSSRRFLSMPKSTKNCVRPLTYSIKPSSGIPAFSSLTASSPSPTTICIFLVSITRRPVWLGRIARSKLSFVCVPMRGRRILLGLTSYTAVISITRKRGPNSPLPSVRCRIIRKSSS